MEEQAIKSKSRKLWVWYALFVLVIVLVHLVFVPIRWLTLGWSQEMYAETRDVVRWYYGFVWPLYTIFFVLSIEFSGIVLHIPKGVRWVSLVVLALVTWMDLDRLPRILGITDAPALGFHGWTGYDWSITEISAWSCMFSYAICLAGIVLYARFKARKGPRNQKQDVPKTPPKDTKENKGVGT